MGTPRCLCRHLKAQSKLGGGWGYKSSVTVKHLNDAVGARGLIQEDGVTFRIKRGCYWATLAAFTGALKRPSERL